MIFKDKTFKNETIKLDGNEYVGCSFESCIFIFRGEDSTALDNCTHVDVKFSFGGPAKATLDFLESLYGAGYEKIVDQIIDSIRSGPTLTSRTFN